MPTLASRQSGAWRRTATCIQSGQYRIYYHGEARRDSVAKRNSWSGTVLGDILVISPQGYVLIPDGRLTLGPDNALSVAGPHRTVILDAAR